MENHVDSLTVLVTARCNLSCGYCYRGAADEGDPSWPGLRAALDWAVARAGPRLEVVFSGGEPLLALPLLLRAADHLRGRTADGPELTLRLLTNGTLLTDEIVNRLSRRRIHIQLSCDGSAPAQAFRAHGTHARIDAVLRSLRSRHPDVWTERFTVAATVHPHNLHLLAGSVRYFLERDVREILLQPELTCVDPWRPAWEAELARQFALIVAASREHYDRTERVPLRLLRRGQPGLPGRDGPARPCSAVSGAAPVVDVDGRLYACPLFAGRSARLPARWAEQVREAACWGYPDDPDVEERRRRGSRELGALAPFAGQAGKMSSLQRCDTCVARDTCRICPYAILWLAGDEPRRVPDFPCAFHRHAATARSRMPVQPPPGALRAHPAVIEQQMRAWTARVTRRRRAGA